MSKEGGCYCGELRYETKGDPFMAAQCHCRECQYITGGGPNLILAVPDAEFQYTKGTPSQFSRDDLEAPVTREFCGKCGTAIGTRSPTMPGAFILKVGTLDDSSDFKPAAAVYTCDKQPYHQIPEGVAEFERVPG